MSISEPLDDPWADSGPGDRLPASRRRPEGDRPFGIRRARDDQRERGQEGEAWEGGGASFERVPPQDLEAEQSVLGGMLLSKDAIADVVEVLKGYDFYRPAHETVYQAILDLYAKGEPADPITVAAELTRRGEITRVGGAAYLHSLVQTVPTAANAEYYAEIVHERAVLRRLVEAGTRITQMGYAADGDVDEIVNTAQAEIYAVTEQRTSEDYLPLGEIMEGALDEIEAIGSRSGEMTGVPTGFTDFDSLTNGLHPGQMIVIAARPAMGKALALDTLLPTPDGWTTMGEVAEGDLLMGADGRPTRVVAATGVLVGRPCYEVTFDDGTTVVADADHQWLTDMRLPPDPATGGPGARATGVRTTKEIAGALRCIPSDTLKHSVRTTAPLALPAREFGVSPYRMGAWLGGLSAPERGHIPEAYLRASVEQRRELLAGLLDSCGTLGGEPFASARLTVAGRRLAEDVCELVVSLGQCCGITPGTAADGGAVAGAGQPYQVTFDSDGVFSHDPVGVTGPGAEPGPRSEGDGGQGLGGSEPGAPSQAVSVTARVPETGRRRYITGVHEVASVPVRCVQVDNADRLYLATRSMVPTHNSTLALDFARAASIKNDLASVIFSLEMGRNEIAMRLLSAEARVALHHMRSGTMTDDDWTRLARRMPEVTAAPLYIDDSPNLSMMEIRAKCRRLKQRHDLKLVVIDYLQLMQSGGSRRPESRQQEVSDMSRNLKLLAKELELPVVALSQLNRGPEQRTDKKPMVSDLRESGCVTAGTRVLRADTGAEVTMGELLASGARDIPVWSLDDALRLVPRTMTHVFPSGTKEVFRLRLASGREIEATANHPFLTYDGWTPLGDLSAGSRIATPRRLDPPDGQEPWPDAEVILLAHLIGNGGVAPRQPVYCTSDDDANLAAVEEAASHFGITPRRVRQGSWWQVYLPDPHRPGDRRRPGIAAWLDRLGLYGKRADEKFLPPELFALPDDQLRLFLRHLWATNGAVAVAKSGAVHVHYATTSERLARDLQMLLLRLDIRARLSGVGNHAGRSAWTVSVCGVDEQRRFLAGVGAHGRRALGVSAALERLDRMQEAGRREVIPAAARRRVREVVLGRGRSSRDVPSTAGTDVVPSAVRADSPSARNRLAEVAEALDDAALTLLSTNDVFWDEVVSIESIGDQEVYDATVPGTHNFIANGINLHNSIEQDADMVILLHREDAYEKESPRAGEADLIVAKHRNGPTATITVAFQGHYSRFVDMAGV